MLSLLRNPKLSTGLMAASALFFSQDVMHDIWEHRQADIAYSTRDLVHLIFEMIAVLALLIAIRDVLTNIRRLRNEKIRQTNQLKYLREDFDELVHHKFGTWDLTEAERDVALMLLRGLTLDEISQVRNVSKGTVKVQSHKVMQKANVASRVELMSLFLDEFMDAGMSQALTSTHVPPGAPQGLNDPLGPRPNRHATMCSRISSTYLKKRNSKT